MIAIDPAVAAEYPEATVTFVVVENAAAPGADALAAVTGRTWEQARARLDADGITLESIAATPAFAVWRRAIGRCGVKPATYRSSVEAVARRLLRSGPFSTGLPLVDLYCALSAAHLAPLGAYDLERVPAGDMVLRFARPATDRFEPLGGRAEDMPLLGSVVVYAVGSEVLCWAWNHRDSARTGLTLETGRAMFLSESVDLPGRDRSRAALEGIAVVLAGLGARPGPIVSVGGATAAGS